MGYLICFIIGGMGGMFAMALAAVAKDREE